MRKFEKKLEIYQCVRYPHLGPLYERKVLPDMTDSLILKIIFVVTCHKPTFITEFAMFHPFILVIRSKKKF